MKEHNQFRKIYHEYGLEFLFAIGLIAVMWAVTYWAKFIPFEVTRTYIAPLFSGGGGLVFAVCALFVWRHNKGLRVRKQWVVVLIFFSIVEYLLYTEVFAIHAPQYLFSSSTISLRQWETTIGNIFAWILLIYPTEVLRPNWLTFKRAVLQVIPIFVLGIADYLIPADLSLLQVMYPVLLIVILFQHIRAYRNWCEENYSTLDDIDEQWIMRYLILIFAAESNYTYMCFAKDDPSRAFTQQLLLLFTLVYATDQILYRPDPWTTTKAKKGKQPIKESETVEPVEIVEENNAPRTDEANAEYRRILEEWMTKEKPYLDTDFRLDDMRKILPLNRTYLSAMFKNDYGCTFYQFVTKYRIEEAKRLMTEHPELKIQEIAEQSGFSSSTVFGRIFAREEGLTPTEWIAETSKSSRKVDNS